MGSQPASQSLSQGGSPSRPEEGEALRLGGSLGKRPSELGREQGGGQRSATSCPKEEKERVPSSFLLASLESHTAPLLPFKESTAG